MKRKLLIATLLTVGICASSYAQNDSYEEYQNYLNRSNERLAKKQRLIDEQHGDHFGFSSSLSTLLSLNGGICSGISFFYGNRVSEHWLLGATVGADILTPSRITYYDYASGHEITVERPNISFPVTAEFRLYFGTSHFMPYWVTNIGASISKYCGAIFYTGLGADINFKDSHTIFISTGIGTTPVPGISNISGIWDTEQKMVKKQPFSLNLKLGYYF